MTEAMTLSPDISLLKPVVPPKQARLDFSHALVIGKDELNLVDIPFALLSHRASPKKNGEAIKTIQVNKNFKTKNGEVKTGRVVVTASDAYGLPLPSDTDIWMAILFLFKTHKFENHTVFFTRYELLSVLGWPKTKQYYIRFKAGLDRLKTVNIVFERCWWNSVHQTYTSTAFNLIDNYEIFDERVEGGREKSYIKLNDVVFDNCQTGYIKSLNLNFYLSLSSSITKQLFRVLDKQSQNKITYQIGIRKIAHERLGMPGSYYVSQIKRLLLPALEELKAHGFLAEWKFDADNLVVFFSKTVAEPEFDRSKSLASFLSDELGDPKSYPFYIKVSRLVPEPVIYRILGELKEAGRSVDIKNRGKYFTRLILNEAQNLSIKF